MSMTVSGVNLSNVQCKQPSFGSVALSRVVLRQVQPNGDIYYRTLPNDDKLKGVYQSLALRVNKSKDSGLLSKLRTVFNDMRGDDPKIASTATSRSSTEKRFILTGMDARLAKDIGKDLAGALDDKAKYHGAIKNNILSDYSRRVINKNGEEVALDLIVEENSKGKRKLVDVEISTLSEISRPKAPVKKAPQSAATQPPVGPKQEEPTQGTFDFLDDVKNPDTPPGIYD